MMRIEFCCKFSFVCTKLSTLIKTFYIVARVLFPTSQHVFCARNNGETRVGNLGYAKQLALNLIFAINMVYFPVRNRQQVHRCAHFAVHAHVLRTRLHRSISRAILLDTI